MNGPHDSSDTPVPDVLQGEPHGYIYTLFAKVQGFTTQNPTSYPCTSAHTTMSQAEATKQAQLTEHFDKHAERYEDKNGGVTNVMYQHLLALCASGPFPSPITPSSIIHDNASGPGTLVGEVIQLPQFAVENVPKIYCTDVSPAMIKALDAKGWNLKYGVEGAVMDGQELSFPDNKFTHSFTNASIFLFPDPVKGTKEIYRTLKPGGVALVTTIRRSGRLTPFHNAQKRVRPDEKPWQGLQAPEWYESAYLKKLMLEGGFVDDQLAIQSFTVPFEMKDFVRLQGEAIDLFTKVLTQGWSQGEVEEFEVALQDEFKAYIEAGTPSSMEMWIAIAKKNFGAQDAHM